MKIAVTFYYLSVKNTNKACIIRTLKGIRRTFDVLIMRAILLVRSPTGHHQQLLQDFFQRLDIKVSFSKTEEALS